MPKLQGDEKYVPKSEEKGHHRIKVLLCKYFFGMRFNASSNGDMIMLRHVFCAFEAGYDVWKFWWHGGGCVVI